MVLGWFKGAAKEESVDDLVARREFGKAADLIREQLRKTPRDQRLRQHLADTLALGGHNVEAISLLRELADEYVEEGFVAKGIAVLKKIQKIDPSDTTVEHKLAGLVEGHEQEAATGPFRKSAISAAIGGGEATPASLGGSGSDDDGEIGFELTEDEPIVLPSSAPEPPAPAPAPRPAPRELPAEALAEEPGDSTTVRKEKAEERRWREIAATPLFTDFTRDELVAVIQGMNLRSFDEGDIVVTENEPGDSLFVITTGRVKVFTKNPKGRHVPLATLSDGDFFGEVSVLTGKPRTATITAATRCDVLELSKPTLDGIAAKHPHVREVLERFYRQRVDQTVEAMISSLRS